MRNTRNVAEAKLPRKATALLAVCGMTVLLSILSGSSASANVGIEKVSRHGGRAGDEVTLTLACGFCFPPCKGPKGNRHPDGFDHGPCMLGTRAEPPRSFGISVVPQSKAPRPRRCGPHSVCLPELSAPPRRHPFTFLGLAVPPPGGNNPEHGDPPRYFLHFAIPDLQPGHYAYVIWCGACKAGNDGVLLSFPASRLWRLGVRRPSRASASPSVLSLFHGRW